MRTSIGLLFALSMVGPGCTAVLGVDQLQGGDTGAQDATVAAIDAHLPDANLPDALGVDAFGVDTGVDASLPDAFVVGDDSGLDAGSDAGHDATVPSVGVSGTIVGLTAGSMITLQNGSDTQSISGGTTTFRFDVAMGAAYSVSVASAPSTLLCVIYRGSGTASADVTNLFVGCSTALNLVSYFPFDGDMHAARGSDWTTATGSIPYVTDRAGQPSHALEAATTGFDFEMNYVLNGDSTMVAANSTQFTVTLWALIPSSLTNMSGEGMFGHLSAVALSTDAQIQWHGGLPYFEHYLYWDGGFTQAVTTSTTALDRDHWHQIAISASGPSTSPTTFFVRSVYVDGVREGTTSTCCGFGNTTRWWGLEPSRVQRDDVRIYSRMLSDAEVAGIYAAEHVP